MSEDQLNEYLDMDLINQDKEISTSENFNTAVEEDLFDNFFDDESIQAEEENIINNIDINDENINYDSFYEIMYA